MYPQIEADLKTALLARDSLTADTLKLLKSAINNKKIELKLTELDDEAVMAVVRSEAKKRVEAIEMYEKAGNTEAAEKEKSELVVLEKYLPKQMDDEELSKLVAEVQSELGDVHMGQIIQEVIKRSEGRADGKRVAEAVRNTL